MGAFGEGERVFEVEDGLAESAQQMQRFPVRQFDLLIKVSQKVIQCEQSERSCKTEALKRSPGPTSIHVFEGLLGLLRSLKLHISIAPGHVWVESVHGHFNHFYFPISGKDLLDVIL